MGWILSAQDLRALDQGIPVASPHHIVDRLRKEWMCVEPLGGLMRPHAELFVPDPRVDRTGDWHGRCLVIYVRGKFLVWGAGWATEGDRSRGRGGLDTDRVGVTPGPWAEPMVSRLEEIAEASEVRVLGWREVFRFAPIRTDVGTLLRRERPYRVFDHLFWWMD